MIRLIFRGLVVQCREKLLCELEVAHVGLGLSLCLETAKGLCESVSRQVGIDLVFTMSLMLQELRSSEEVKRSSIDRGD